MLHQNYKFQLRHLPSGGFVRRTGREIDNQLVFSYYITDPGIEGIFLTDAEWREAMSQLCGASAEHQYMTNEFVLIRVPNE